MKKLTTVMLITVMVVVLGMFTALETLACHGCTGSELENNFCFEINNESFHIAVRAVQPFPQKCEGTNNCYEFKYEIHDLNGNFFPTKITMKGIADHDEKRMKNFGGDAFPKLRRPDNDTYVTVWKWEYNDLGEDNSDCDDCNYGYSQKIIPFSIQTNYKAVNKTEMRLFDGGGEVGNPPYTIVGPAFFEDNLSAPVTTIKDVKNGTEVDCGPLLGDGKWTCFDGSTELEKLDGAKLKLWIKTSDGVKLETIRDIKVLGDGTVVISIGDSPGCTVYRSGGRTRVRCN